MTGGDDPPAARAQPDPQYYRARLAGERLRRCYEIAPPAVRRYLEDEIEHAASRIAGAKLVLELGCGYGRILSRLAERRVVTGGGSRLIGIDTALESLLLARRELRPPAFRFLLMDGARLAFRDGAFDAVLCLQNGISAFRVDREALLREALRVTRPGGTVLFSTYAKRFWPERLEWFEAHAAEGLIGEIDRTATREGTIVCTDGFRATTASPEELRALASVVGVSAVIEEVSGSSVFCEIRVAQAPPGSWPRAG